jgi:hypothetical protein
MFDTPEEADREQAAPASAMHAVKEMYLARVGTDYTVSARFVNNHVD